MTSPNAHHPEVTEQWQLDEAARLLTFNAEAFEDFATAWEREGAVADGVFYMKLVPDHFVKDRAAGKVFNPEAVKEGIGEKVLVDWHEMRHGTPKHVVDGSKSGQARLWKFGRAGREWYVVEIALDRVDASSAGRPLLSAYITPTPSPMEKVVGDLSPTSQWERVVGGAELILRKLLTPARTKHPIFPYRHKRP